MPAPTKLNKIDDKLLAIIGWAERGRNSVSDIKVLEGICKEIAKESEELWLYVRTPDEQGRKWEWW